MDSAAELTLKFHSASDLKDVKKSWVKMDPYALVWIEGCGEVSTKVRTPMARRGGCSPKWDYTMKFHIVPVKQDYSLYIHVKHEGTTFDRHIASVEIPFSLLLAPDAPTGEPGTYPLRLPNGERKGQIVFSYEFSELVVIGGGRGITNVTDSGVLRKRDKARKFAFKFTRFSITGGYHAGLLLLTHGHSAVPSLISLSTKYLRGK